MEGGMPTLKLTGITAFCVAGTVVQPDANGLAVVSDEVLADPEFARLRSELTPGQSIDAVEPTDDGDEDEAKTPRRGRPRKVESIGAPSEG
jgi:hypothetical protein